MLGQVEIINYPPEELKNCKFQYDDLTIEGGAKESSKAYFSQKKKYTGCAINFVNNRIGYYAYKFSDGKLEQLIVTYENGLLERDFRFKNGLADGFHRMWFEDGRKYIEENYKDGKPLKRMRWYDNGQLAREVNYKNEQLVNELLYKRDGTLKSTN